MAHSGQTKIDDTRLDRVRHFSRFYTRQFGLLNRQLLDSPYSLTEGRVIYELANNEGVTANMLVASLGLDAGYLSRILKAFETKGMLTRRRAEHDGRSMIVELTPQGRTIADDLADRSRAEVRGMIGTLPPADIDRLLSSLADAETLLSGNSAGDGTIVLRPHRAGDMGWVIGLHGELYAREYGWNSHAEGLTARICADFLANFDPARERCWIADQNGRRLGCVFIVREDDDTARLRLLLLDPAARGRGLGQQLVEECIRFCRDAGYSRIVLWTNHVLVAARRIYENKGFRLVDEKKHRDFGPELVGQTWMLELQ
ncbi:MAG: GNAT family N-acetyltransferase [Alphaproteobacteria bacterium]|nr:MAG: GNAT family N-acetyltransferase [Alphaproteobacteria bacterium]